VADIVTLPYHDPRDRAAAADRLRRHLREGGLIAYPTETVYGFGCALMPGPLRRLSRLKGRGPDQPFLVLIRNPDDVGELAWTDAARRLAAAFWPGPLTLALADPGRRFPDAVRSRSGTVAVRVSPHPAAAQVLEACGGPVTSTSANRPGDPPSLDAGAAGRAFGADERRALVLDGGSLPPSQPSTILDCSGGAPRLLRAGALPITEIEAFIRLAHD
jgi:L-threonylcarbamoyladenylate synthase